GAQILFYPTAIGWIPKEPRAVAQRQRNAWEIIQRSHAVANGVYVAAVNRVGREGKLRFWGHSFVAGPFGEILACASGERDEIIIVKCDLDKIEETRQSWPSCAIGASMLMDICDPASLSHLTSTDHGFFSAVLAP